MPSYRKILYQVDGAVARITLNRPEKRNALDAELIGEIKDALREAEGVVVLTGAGKDFCSGADLAAFRDNPEAGVLKNMADARGMAELFLAMRRYPGPIVAVVRGRALAGGCGLATACDLIVASESAQFGYPEVNIGFLPAMVMAILRRSLPEKRAFELIVTGETLGAHAARDAGLINRVFADATFDADVDAYVQKLAAKPASAVLLSKQLLYHMDGMAFEAALEAGVQMNGIARMTDDFKRGVAKWR